MDVIFLSEVKVQTKLGVPAWERLLPQTIVLDIEMRYDLSKAGKTDSIADTVNYGAVVSRIRESLTKHSFRLVEALAEHVCQLILQEFGVLHVKIKVAKPGILPGLKALGVVIERSFQPLG
ncbi:MAG: dihydroneopterin aldolase [Methylotenera sp.]|nr:dihydroneopterin aldolase [Methylotenera sp.]MSQ00042.1 dihydroneopterin aldolase [Methylotenera sp.]